MFCGPSRAISRLFAKSESTAHRVKRQVQIIRDVASGHRDLDTGLAARTFGDFDQEGGDAIGSRPVTEQKDAFPRPLQCPFENPAARFGSGVDLGRRSCGESPQDDARHRFGGLAILLPVDAEDVVAVEETGELAMPVTHEPAGANGSGHDLVPVTGLVALMIDDETFVEADQLSGRPLPIVAFARIKRDQKPYPTPDASAPRVTRHSPSRLR
jgi:hypothetical protein